MNGNVTQHVKDDVENMYWDEQDRLKALISENGVFQYYVYDDKGEEV
jgi:hypothetical protein